MITEHASEWLGKPVKLFDPVKAADKALDCAGTIYRLALGWDSKLDFPALFAEFLNQPNVAETKALIIGHFFKESPADGGEEVVELLVSARTKLPLLQGIFIGDLISEECEVSWIELTDVSPLFTAYPQLEHLRLRGTGQLSLGRRCAHDKLKSLTIETGGLPPALWQEVLAAQLPALETLELWLGTSMYGGDVTLADLEPLLQGRRFPALRHLGLRNSEIADQIAAALPQARVLEQLQTLDLSLGTLGDEGGQALLDNPALRHLQMLDLHRHFLSNAMMTALQKAYPSVDLADPQNSKTDSDDRYVAVGE